MPTSKGLVRSVENGDINLYAVSQKDFHNVWVCGLFWFCFFFKQVIECHVSVVLSKSLDLFYFYKKTAVRIMIKI